MAFNIDDFWAQLGFMTGVQTPGMGIEPGFRGWGSTSMEPWRKKALLDLMFNDPSVNWEGLSSTQDYPKQILQRLIGMPEMTSKGEGGWPVDVNKPPADIAKFMEYSDPTISRGLRGEVTGRQGLSPTEILSGIMSEQGQLPRWATNKPMESTKENIYAGIPGLEGLTQQALGSKMGTLYPELGRGETPPWMGENWSEGQKDTAYQIADMLSRNEERRGLENLKAGYMERQQPKDYGLFGNLMKRFGKNMLGGGWMDLLGLFGGGMGDVGWDMSEGTNWGDFDWSQYA